MNEIELDVDLSPQGLSTGWIRLPHSHDRAGYGTVATPIVVLANGEGPTLLLIAGNHGDEYEGQVALSRLTREVDVAKLCGRVIVLPAANLPAAVAGTRLSPLDGGNLNRLFGARIKSPTGLLATFIESELLPLASCVIDMHSGGRSMTYLPSVFVQDAQEPSLRELTREIVNAFGAPWCIVKTRVPSEATLLGACGRARLPYISTELAGGERLDRGLVDLAIAGALRVMSVLGMIRDAPIANEGRPTWLSLPDWSVFSYAEMSGVFECMRSLGCKLVQGDVLGTIHVPEHPSLPPQPVRVRSSGILVCVRTIARVHPGDCLGHIGCLIR